MNPQFLVKVLNSTSLSSDEILEYMQEYTQTIMILVLEQLLAFMDEKGMREELNELRDLLEKIEKEDETLEEIAEGDEPQYERWNEIISEMLTKYADEELMTRIDRSIEELDNETIDDMLDNLSEEDRGRVLERINILVPEEK